MAHYQQQEFCKLINKFFFKEKKIAILEIGSCNVNGTIRNIFTNNIKYEDMQGWPRTQYCLI